MWEEFKPYILDIIDNTETDLFITYNHVDERIQDAKKYSKEDYLLDNKGLDIAPFIYVLGKIINQGYSVVTKIHSKKSLHHGNLPEFGETWRKKLYTPLISSVENYNKNISLISENPGVLGCAEYFFTAEKDHNNFLINESLSEKIYILENILDKKFERRDFLAGSIYMMSIEYIRKILDGTDIDFFYSQFEDGYSQGNLLSHAFERVIGYGISKYNYKFNLI